MGKSGENKMFIGQYEHSVDQKGRLAIPSKFRKNLSDGAVVTKGLDGCLFLFSRAKWQEMAENIGQLPETKSSARLYSRLILAGASEAEFDNQGRVLIPAYLRKYAGVKSSVVVAGVYDRIEIWSKAVWDKYIEKNEKEAAEIVESLSESRS